LDRIYRLDPPDTNGKNVTVTKQGFRERIPEALGTSSAKIPRELTSLGVVSQFDKIAAPLHRSQRASMRLPTPPEKWFLTAFLDPPSIRST
jgi:hypothetical protein